MTELWPECGPESKPVLDALAERAGGFVKWDKTDLVGDDGFRQHTLEYPEATKEEIFEALHRFHRCSHLRPKRILRTIRTMMEDKDIFVRRCRDPFVTGPAGERRRFHLVSTACEV